MRRRKGIRWDYNGDGQFATEWLAPVWKRYWRRWLRRMSRARLREDLAP